MAIIDESNKSNAQQQQATQEQARPIGTGQSFSFHTQSLFAAPIGTGIGSEYYSKLKQGLIDIYKTANDNVEIALIDLDRANTPALAFSAIIVALRFKADKNSGTAYHIIVLEATGDKPTPRFEVINGQQIEITRVTSDAIDQILLAKAQEKINKAFPNGPHYMVDGVVVPVGFNPENKVAMQQLALNAGLACGTELEIQSQGYADINLAQLQHDSTMNINVGFNRQQIDDAVGCPMRSDVLLSFVSRKNNQQQNNTSMNSGDREAKVSEVSGFVDLLWNPVTPVQNSIYMHPMQQQQMQNQMQKYVARLVITNLASEFAYTPGSVLLALATALAMRDDNNWIQAFRPMSVSDNTIDMTDIGALNIEANLLNDPTGYGKRIDTKVESFKLEDLGQLAATLIQPGLIISIDCPEVGPQTWYTSVFSAAANGSQAAYRIIFDAANRLTNGAFAKYFPNGSAMFVDPNNRVHLGTWIDRNGMKRDIRDIDHVAVANLVGERNPQLIRDWSDTWLRTNYPLAQRLAARKKMISALTNETATFTGFAQRVTPSAAFLDALSKGIRETGMPVRVNTPLSGNDLLGNQRGVASFAGSALLAPGQSFVAIPYGNSYQQNMNNMGNSFRY